MSSFCWYFLPAVSRSQARVKYIKHVVRDEGDVCFSFSTSGSVVCLQVRHTATAVLWGLSRQCQAKVHGRRKLFENSHASRASWKNFQRRTNSSKMTLFRTRKDEVRSVTSTEHGEITLSWRCVGISKN